LSLQTIARRYASALADVVIERREEREVQKEIQLWASMIDSNPQLKEVFANPTVAYDQKRNLLEELISRTRISCLKSQSGSIRSWTNAPESWRRRSQQQGRFRKS
jgi:F0F1-type ATP synthase delta subunit